MNCLKNKKIAILGAGIVGLSTAIRLFEINDSDKLDVTIISKEFGTATTSDGAGGLFRPDDRFIPGVPRDIVRKWSEDSFKYYHDILFSKDGGKAGVFQVSGYQLFNDDREDPSYKDIVYEFRHLTQNELNMFPDKYRNGYFSTTICIDVRLFMKYLTDTLILKGVKFICKDVTELEEFVRESNFDVLFTCVGLNAAKLCHDKLILPIRGQMLRVKAPWVKHFYYTDDNCYIIPNVETICLGGTRQINNYQKSIDAEDSKGILERCLKLCPSLKSATIEWEWVGLRPHREPIRVEADILKNSNGQNVIVVHHYGHGGNGISLSRGTANHAVNLLINELNKSNVHSKL